MTLSKGTPPLIHNLKPAAIVRWEASVDMLKPLT
jgi:hypothetical protein